MSSVSLLRLLSPRPRQPNAPLFIYLPGGDGTGQLFHRQLASLEKGFDIRCLEIPPDDLTGWDDLADQVIELIQAELVETPRSQVYLCGESFGGCLALKIMQHSPHLFHYLILVNPASAFRHHSWLYSLSFLAHPVPAPIYRFFWIWFLPVLAALGRMEAEDRRVLLTAVQSMPQETSIWRVGLLRKFHISDAELQKITQPTLVVASGCDAILPSLAEAERLTIQFPNAQKYVLQNSGHACLLEKDVHLYDILQATGFLPIPSADLPLHSVQLE